MDENDIPTRNRAKKAAMVAYGAPVVFHVASIWGNMPPSRQPARGRKVQPGLLRLGERRQPKKTRFQEEMRDAPQA
jgi:hypothetical protein